MTNRTKIEISPSTAEAMRLSQVEKPSRYIGREFGSVIKEESDIGLHVALAFPDVYEIGMSHIGLKILYGLINQRPDFWAERVMAVWPDREEQLRSDRRPLASLESGRPLDQFDLIGFSLQYELSYTNILNMLDLAGIPFEAGKRDSRHPLVIGGGPNAYNPEPIADFFDFFYLGDAEAGLLDVLDRVAEWKTGGGDKEELYDRLAGLPGVYVPSLFEPRYGPEGRLTEIRPLKPGYERVKRAVSPDLTPAYYPYCPVVPFTQLVHDRLAIEIARGCTRGCRFCQAGFIYRPVREREPSAILNLAEKNIKNSGMDETSFLSLSAGDYSDLNRIMSGFMDAHSGEHVALSLPSLRVKSLTPEMMRQIKRVRKTGFTLAPEAGSQRLRDVINKDLTENDLIQAGRGAFELGWRLIKLYFMIGLPTETDEDIAAIGQLAHKMRAGTRGKVNVSFGVFVPKPHTPFQWEPMTPRPEIERKKALLLEHLKSPGLKPKWNPPDSSLVESVIARGDRRLAPVLARLQRYGVRFESWGERLNMDLWLRAMAEENLTFEEYLRSRDTDEVLPWNHLRPGPTPEYLLKERERAIQGTTTADCRYGDCGACGACDFTKIKPRLVETGPPAVSAEPAEQSGPIRSDDFQRFFIHFSKTEPVSVLSHLELAGVFIRALRRTGLRSKMSQGFHPHPKLTFLTPLPVGLASLDEMALLDLTTPTEPGRLVELLNRQLPTGFQVLTAELCEPNRPKPRVKGEIYRLVCERSLFDPEIYNRVWARDRIPVSKKSKTGFKEFDLKVHMNDFKLLTQNSVELTLYNDQEGVLRPQAAAAALFELSPEDLAGCSVLKLKTILHG